MIITAAELRRISESALRRKARKVSEDVQRVAQQGFFNYFLHLPIEGRALFVAYLKELLPGVYVHEMGNTAKLSWL